MKAPGPVVRLVIGAILVLTGWIQVSRAAGGTRTLRLEQGGMPMLLMLPDVSEPRPVDPGDLGSEPADAEVVRRYPAVIVVHGFGASKQIMLGYGIALARAGHAVLLPDLSGHGGNTTPFRPEQLDRDLETAWRVLDRQPEVDRDRTALLGHSLGTSIVLRAATEHPERYRAVVAVSPVPAEVNATTPRNLMLQAGSWETTYLRHARELLEAAGGEGGELQAGTARELVVVPAAGHLGILFRPASQRAARRWIAAALDTEAAPVPPFLDLRPLWYAVQVLGWVVILGATAPIAGRARRPPPWRLRPVAGWICMGLTLPATAVALAAAAQVVDLPSVGGIAVGGALSLWLLVAGITTTVVAAEPGRPRAVDVAFGAALFAFLWLVVGPLGQQVWVHWGLGGRRWWLWPLLGLAAVPWFAVTEALLREASGWQRLVAWAVQSGSFVVGGLLLARWVPSLAVVAVLLPLLPLLLALLIFAGTRFDRPWAYGLGCGAFWGWLVAATFPVI